MATLVVGLLVTLALVLVSHSQYVSNEKRLINLRARDAAALLAESLPTTTSTLAAAVEQANFTNGSVARFKRLVGPEVGTKSGQFLSLSLWKLGALNQGPVAVVGTQPKLVTTHGNAAALLAAAGRKPVLNVIGLLQPPDLRLGYAYANSTESGGYVVYGERPLPANRRSRLQGTSQFAGLDYAIYLGGKQTPQSLLVTDLAHLPLPSPSYAQTVPYGNSVAHAGDVLPRTARRLAAEEPAVDQRRARRAADDRGGGHDAASHPAPPAAPRTSPGDWRSPPTRTSASTPSSAASPRPCSTRCCPTPSPSSPASRPAPATRPARRASTSAGTGTT